MLLIFLMISLTPVDPASTLLPAEYTQEQYDALVDEMGFDDPLIVQYGRFVWKALHGDFGFSYTTRVSVMEDVAPRIPVSAKLALYTTLFVCIVALPLGVLCAVKQYSFLDTAVNLFSKFLGSIPGFWLAMLLLLIFSQKLGWLPSYGITSWKSYILPVISLGLTSAAVFLRQVRSSMLDCIREYYVRTARSKGATEGTVIFRDALRNAMLPIITMLGGQFAQLMGGALVVENVFAIPGLGSRCIQAVLNKDIPVLLTCVMFLCLFFVAATLVIDLFYALIDPRIKAAFTKGKISRKAMALAIAQEEASLQQDAPSPAEEEKEANRPQ